VGSFLISDNPQVAYVDKTGKVTGKSEGTAKITVKSAEGAAVTVHSRGGYGGHCSDAIDNNEE
jgi:uncharacterized protein YjdB